MATCNTTREQAIRLSANRSSSNRKQRQRDILTRLRTTPPQARFQDTSVLRMHPMHQINALVSIRTLVRLAMGMLQALGGTARYRAANTSDQPAMWRYMRRTDI